MPTNSLKEYWDYTDRIAARQSFRERCSSVEKIGTFYGQDCWIFHSSANFDVFQPVVAGRGMVDTYLMSRVNELKISMVDVTYAVMMLHQGFDNYLQKASRNKYSPQDINYNYAIWSGLDMKKVCMSIPGDQVMCRK